MEPNTQKRAILSKKGRSLHYMWTKMNNKLMSGIQDKLNKYPSLKIKETPFYYLLKSMYRFALDENDVVLAQYENNQFRLLHNFLKKKPQPNIQEVMQWLGEQTRKLQNVVENLDKNHSLLMDLKTYANTFTNRHLLKANSNRYFFKVIFDITIYLSSLMGGIINSALRRLTIEERQDQNLLYRKSPNSLIIQQVLNIEEQLLIFRLNYQRIKSSNIKKKSQYDSELHLAAWAGNFKKIKELVANGADLNSLDRDGRTVFEIAKLTNQKNIQFYILKKGAKLPNEKPNISIFGDQKPRFFNPHRHVKIWLSKDPNLFMNEENKLRLVKMRELCDANDEISLIYDSKLLNNKAIDELNTYCQKHKLLATDIRTLFQSCTSEKEKKLIQIYEDEIKNLNSGGNLAAASDILRWLKPVFIQGVYADFDNDIRTQGLPDTIEVYSDILLNAGSFLDQRRRQHFIYNNDIVAIINPDAANITNAQQHIIDAYQPRDIITWIDRIHFKNITDQNKSLIQESYRKVCHQMSDTSLSPIEFRSNIPNIIQKMQDLIEQQSSTDNLDRDQLNQDLARIEHRLYLQCVVQCSGPGASYQLFNNDKESMSASLSSYPSIFNAFRSSQALVLRAKDYSVAHAENRCNDLSWMKAGQSDIEQREQNLESNARKIQEFFKENLSLSRKKPEQKITTKISKKFP